MKLHAYLSKSRHGIFYFRWPLPNPGPNRTRKTLRLSLGTRCPKDAASLARQLSALGEALNLEALAPGMNHAELRAKAERYFRANLEEGKRRRSTKGPFTGKEKEGIKDAISWREMENEDYWHLLGKDNARTELDRFCDGAGVEQPTTKVDAMMILDEIRKAQLAQFRALLDHGLSLDGYDFSEPPSGPVEPSTAHSVTPPGTTLKEAVETFLGVHGAAEGWAAGTVEKRRAILDIALEWFGPDADMYQIGKKDAAAFKNEVLLNLPTNRSKGAATRGLSLRDAIAVPGMPKITNATINSYLSAYKNLWVWAEAHGHAPEVLFDGLSVSKKRGTSKNREPFTQEALTKTYNALTDPGSKFYRKGSHRWATLIAMFSGARLNEVCQLQLNDIKEIDGIWVFDFTDQGDDTKRLKTSAAQRRVPVHSHLIELGLLNLISVQQDLGHDRLFPDFTYTEKAGYGDKLSKWFNRTFTPKLDIKTKNHTFHGMRRTFISRLLQAGIETPKVQFVVGHERDGVTQQHYFSDGYTLTQAAEVVERFSVGL